VFLFGVILGGALEPVSIDLLAALNLHNTSQHEGVSITEGYRNQRIATINKIAYHLQGKCYSSFINPLISLFWEFLSNSSSGINSNYANPLEKKN